jgi:hypothetical protein
LPSATHNPRHEAIRILSVIGLFGSKDNVLRRVAETDGIRWFNLLRSIAALGVLPITLATLKGRIAAGETRPNHRLDLIGVAGLAFIMISGCSISLRSQLVLAT